METYVKLSLWAALLIVYGTAASDLSIVRSGNKYMDSVLAATAEKESATLDAVRLPGFEANNRDRFLFVNVKVKTSYSNGYLRNLHKVTRLGDCVPENNFPIVQLACTVQFNHLRIDYRGRMKYGQLPKISITAKATVRPVEALLVIANNTMLTRGLKLQSFDLTSPVEIDPAFTGMGLLNRYLKMLKDNFVDNVEHYVEQAIRREFVPALNRTLIDEGQLKS